tara:strand:+ start:1780 stop:1995 length:216 start_codon:yes stop_codon:yes gene_type:complete
MYIPQSYQIRDKAGNAHNVWVQRDEITKTYVAAVKSYRGIITGIGEATKPHEAAELAMVNYNERSYAMRQV